MLRDYPVKKDTPGEANDTPHRAFFIGHQGMNGAISGTTSSKIPAQLNS